MTIVIKIKMLRVYTFFKVVIINSFVTRKIITTVKYSFKIGIPERSEGDRVVCNLFCI